jgi:hypothetical protein
MILIFQFNNENYFSVHQIVIAVNKHVMFIVKIDNHLYPSMIDFVFLINQLHVLIVMDSVSYKKTLFLISLLSLHLVFEYEQSTKR